MPLVENDLKHLTVAHGYVELGMFVDANAELEEIDPEVRHVPEVPAARRSAPELQRVFAGEIWLAIWAERSGGDYAMLIEDDVFAAFVTPDDLPSGCGGDGVSFTEALQHIASRHRKGDFMSSDGAFALGVLGCAWTAVGAAEDVGEHEHHKKNGQVFHVSPMTPPPIRRVKGYRVKRWICY